METLTLYDAVLYGSITAVTLIVVLTYFPGNPEDYPSGLEDDENSNNNSAAAASDEKPMTEEELKKAEEERRKETEETIKRLDERQERLKQAGIDMVKVRRLLDEAEAAEANALVPARVLIRAMKGLLLILFFLALMVLAKYLGINWKAIFSKEIAVLEGSPHA